MNTFFARTTSIVLILLLAACGGQEEMKEAKETNAPEAKDPATALIEQFINAKPGDVIEIPAGTIALKRSLTLNVDNVTVRGAGIDKTTLSFAGQVAGAEGMLVNASDFTIEDLAIEDTKGDALKINEGENIVIRRVRTEWTGGPKTENGAYGIYPVQTTNVLIEESVAIGASDAGIYVGQSQNVVVRNNVAEYNVAGIEIENTIDADVYQNVANNNTGGILVFNMPDLPQAGHSTRVYNNQVSNNNTANFAIPGTAVAGVPTGTGILINSNDKIEIFENEIGNNNTANILISSFYSSGLQDREQADSFDGYPETIYIHGNTFGPSGSKAGTPELEQLRVAAFGEDGSLPDIVWDGFVNQEKLKDGSLPASLKICVDNGDAMVMNADAPNGFSSPRVDMESHKCRHERLAAVELELAAGS